MKPLLTITAFATLPLLGLAACKKTDPKPGPDPGDPKTELNECNPYEPDKASGEKKGTWSEANEKDDYPGLLPAVTDPGGGYYMVTLTATASVPALSIQVPGDPYPVINGSAAGSGTPQTRKVAFLAHPGVSYDVRVNPFMNADNFPEDYTISWEYVGIMDCFENNDELSQAKFVPKNETLEAYAHAGFKNVGITENRYDWYKVTLEEAAKLKVEILQSPSDEFMSMKLSRQDNSGITTSRTDISGKSSNNTPGTLYYITSNSVLDPGIYYVRIHGNNAAYNRVYDINAGETMPDSWTKPYKFKVTAVK